MKSLGVNYVFHFLNYFSFFKHISISLTWNKQFQLVGQYNFGRPQVFRLCYNEHDMVFKNDRVVYTVNLLVIIFLLLLMYYFFI